MSQLLQENAHAPIHYAAPREYQTYPGAQYALPTDDLERQRKHTHLNVLFGHKLLFAPVELREGDRVLETGTGPGLWILDLAKAVDPSISMVAVDIESRLFPTSSPENIEFRVESVLHLPAEWTNTFSLVHQRLLIFALTIPEWPVALREIYRVLRPGGWVQLTESTPWREGAYPGRPCTEKLTLIYLCLAKTRNLYFGCAYDMPQMLEDAGFVDIHSVSRFQRMGRWAGESGAVQKRNHIEIFRGMKTPVLQAGGFGYVFSEAEYDALVDGLDQEWDEVPGTQKEMFMLWARKPSN
ncbi:S-adenosyl-L-methionine-dependent methyltransferase [Mycena pura]|uniref:S-adenosyl-L-methionine-dependent methyltransferase n=1 Tax=Mycena pura TaxID=153505 RepID=A0AAD6YH06_9AGAR|nr:S-adenosyl-L-methionine-dependent methyltransferase [Mycena pura]